MRPTAVVLALVFGPAAAAGPFPANGYIAVVPSGAAEAGREHVVHVVARTADGGSLDGARLRADLPGGHVGRILELGQGLYRVELTAPDDPGAATLTVTAKTTDKQELETTLELPVVRGRANGLELGVEPELLVLGDASQASLTLRAPGSGSLEASALEVRTTAGRVPSLGQGDERKGDYQVADVKFPHLGLITAADPHDADVFGWTLVRLAGKVPFPVSAAPNAEVTVKVDGETFGPVTANAQGKARVPLVVPPGVQEGVLSYVTDKRPETSTLDLKVPDSRRLLFVPPPAEIPRDPEASTTLRLVVLRANGRPDPRAALKVETTAGSVEEAVHRGQGLYEVLYSPPPDGDSATVTARIDGEDKQTDSVELRLVEPSLSRVALRTIPETLEPDTEVVNLYAYMSGPGASDVASEQLVVDARNASLTGAIVEAEEAVFAGSFRLDEPGVAPRFVVRVDEVARGRHVAGLFVMPYEGALPADGRSRTPVLVGAVDRLGRPVPGVRIDLQMTTGGGRIDAVVTTDRAGIGKATYTAGNQAGLAGFTATMSGLSAGSGLLLGPPGTVPLDLPASGAPSTRIAALAWETTHPTLAFELLIEPEPEAVADGGAEVPPESADKPARPEKQPRERAPRERRERPEGDDELPLAVFSAQLRGGLYSYRQRPTASPGSLLPESFLVGFGAGPPAVPLGFGLTAHSFGIGPSFVGGEVGYGVDSHGVGIPGLAGFVSNPMTTVHAVARGRYTVPAGLPIDVGPRLGLLYHSALLLEGDVAAGSVGFRRQRALGVVIGADARAELDIGWAEVMVQTAPSGRSSLFQLDLEAGARLFEPVDLTAGLSILRRRFRAVDDVERGTVSDRLGRLSVGVRYAWQ